MPCRLLFLGGNGFEYLNDYSQSGNAREYKRCDVFDRDQITAQNRRTVEVNPAWVRAEGRWRCWTAAVQGSRISAQPDQGVSLKVINRSKVMFISIWAHAGWGGRVGGEAWWVAHVAGKDGWMDERA